MTTQATQGVSALDPRRVGRLTASQVPGVLIDHETEAPLSPFVTPTDVYWQILNGPKPGKPTRAMERGHRMEPVLLDWAMERLYPQSPQSSLVRQHFAICPTDDRCCCTIDAVVADADGAAPTIGFEAKSISGPRAALLGEEGTSELPLDVLAQIYWQFRCIPSLDVIYAPIDCHLGHSSELRMYTVERPDDGALATIADPALEWFERYPAKKVPPDGNYVTPIEYLRARRRVPNKVVSIADETFELYVSAEQRAKDAQEQFDVVKAALIECMDDAEVATALQNPNWQATYFTQRSAPSVDHQRMKIDGVWDRYCTQGTHRTLRVTLKKEKS